MATLIPPTWTPPDYQVQQAEASQASSQGYTPEPFVVDPQTQTAEGLLPKIIDEKNLSPLMQQAETRAKEAMNARGLLNSSLALQAGHQAVISTALPIAQYDASVYERAATNTTNAKNAALNFAAAAANAASITNAQLNTNVSMANAAAYNQKMLAQAELAAQLAQAQMQAQTQWEMAQLDSQTRMQLGQLDAQTRLSLGQLDAQTRLQVANLDAATRLELGNLDANTRLQLGALDSNTRLQLGTLDSQTRLQLGQLDSSTRLQVASMDNTTRIQLSNIDGTYKQLLQTNQSAANLYDQALTSIASINMSSLSPEAKTSAINFQTATLRDGLNALQNVGNLNYVTSGNIDFGNNATLVFGDTLDANNGGGTTGGGTTSGGGPSYTGSSGTGNSSTIGSGRWALENNTVYSPGGDPLPGYYVDFQGTVFDYNGLPVGNLNDPQMMV